ncbi:MAG: hypothetical protein B7Z68_03740 [Acidobacteria bacterium 21-70-11]|nr:MAG: hypothetical protein B7Z68_03740 [Acidobacteria bacterium 21-70-11]
MSTKFFYALVLTIAATVFQLVLFFAGLQTEHLSTGQYVQWLGVVIDAVVLWLGIKAIRDEQPGRTLTYGQRLGAGVMISLYSGLMSAVYTYLHFRFINANFAEYTIDMLRNKWAAAGLADSQMDQAERMTRMMLAPGVQALLVPVVTVLIGTVLSLIIAALLEGGSRSTSAGPDATA